ncbi:MFS transporter [Sphingosinicella sp. CPCC 101087]|uniref:MFS transporter n=1 Tax=Sphingosinicella sp. CPCC 101087 TaxID=2497754 RepID=UPI00101DC23F|nr:MFS transporter [Sphingosinicella sp. CPCC 101087]
MKVDVFAKDELAPPANPQNAPGPWPPSRTAWYAVWLIAVIHMLSMLDRSIINLLVEPIKRDLLLSDTQISLIIGFAFSGFYALCGLPMARVADSRSRKLILVSGLAIWSLATALCGAARSFAQLFVARGIVGGAESVAGPSSMSMISDLVPPEKLPRAFAIYQLGISAGAASALFVGGLLVAFFTSIGPIHIPIIGLAREWQLVLLVSALPGLVTALLFLFTVPEPTRRNRRASGSVPLREVGRFLLSNRTLFLLLFLSLGIGAIETFGLMAWRPAFYERTYGWEPQHIGPLLALSLVISVPVALIGGTWLAEFMNKRGHVDAMVRVCFLTQALSAPFAIAGPLMPNPWLAFGCGVFGSMFGLMGAPAQNSAIQMVTPNEMRAQISALYLFTISVIGTGLGPLMIALTTDFGFGDESMLRYSMAVVAGILAPGGAFLMWLAMRPYARAILAARAGWRNDG